MQMQSMKLLKDFKSNIDFVGFHGQTIFHNAKEKISKQLGDGKLLSKLTKKTVVYDFRQNDLKEWWTWCSINANISQIIKNKISN